MKTVQLTTQGIKKHLDGTTPEQALVEYIWNGVDAKANSISVDFVLNAAGGAEEITVTDNGGGIALEELDRKFGVFLILKS
jgi:C4-dicarboxylate-specific signal transduction histidine kinase